MSGRPGETEAVEAAMVAFDETDSIRHAIAAAYPHIARALVAQIPDPMADLGPIRARLFRLLCRHRWLCSDRVYYWLMDRLCGLDGWRPLSIRAARASEEAE